MTDNTAARRYDMGIPNYDEAFGRYLVWLDAQEDIRIFASKLPQVEVWFYSPSPVGYSLWLVLDPLSANSDASACKVCRDILRSITEHLHPPVEPASAFLDFIETLEIDLDDTLPNTPFGEDEA